MFTWLSSLLEVDFWVLREGNVGAQVVVQAMVGLVVLQQLNDFACSKLLCVLLGHLHNQLQVLLHVGLQQLLQHMSILECRASIDSGSTTTL